MGAAFLVGADGLEPPAAAMSTQCSTPELRTPWNRLIDSRWHSICNPRLLAILLLLENKIVVSEINYSMIEQSDHRLWHEFKHLRIHAKKTMVCPTGAGCHFIGGSMGDGWRSEPNSANDYRADIPWLQLDEHSIRVEDGSVIYQADPDKLYARVQGMLKNDRYWGELASVLGHEPPYITSQVFDFSTDELISITVQPEDCWIPKLLETYKNLLITDYRYKTAYLIELFNKNQYQGHLDNLEYQNAIYSMPKSTCALDLSGTPLSITYFFDCKIAGRDPTDPANFEDFVARELDFQNYNRYFNSDYFKHSREWCGSRAGLFTKLDYRELFFDLRRPAQGALSQVDLGMIAGYSEKNLDLLDETINLMPLAQREGLWDQVYLLRQELQIAKTRI